MVQAAMYALVIMLNGWTVNSSTEGGGSRGNAIHPVPGFTEFDKCQKAGETISGKEASPAGNVRFHCMPYNGIALDKPGFALVLLSNGWSAIKGEGGGSRGNAVASIIGVDSRSTCETNGEKIRKASINPETMRAFCFPQ